eukprot:15471189-Alexandrium_andersonii.AAC.1
MGGGGSSSSSVSAAAAATVAAKDRAGPEGYNQRVNGGFSAVSALSARVKQLPALPLRGGYRPPGPPRKAPAAHAGGAFWG